MRLADILAAHRITVRLEATDKASALRAMAELFVDDVEGIDADRIAAVFEEREALASTGVGSGVAIPHGRIEGVPTLLAAVGLSREGLDFDAIDGRPVHIFVALLGPRNLDHLKALARFSRLLRSEHARRDLLGAASPADALDRICAADR
ncbi:MAG: PTS sugar transporter subunit IIA [Sandaracinaceae bacterium]|nr:PTS sugar transporter subunit IIA [Sandaracinaceae bacterium]